MEVFQEFGNDLQLTLQGDLQSVDGVTLSVQRVVRRLLTNPGDYTMRPSYGAGLPRFIGESASPAIYGQIRGLITSNMYEEASVSQNPAPKIELSGLSTFLLCVITYTVVLPNTQVVVSLNVASREFTFETI